MLTRFGRSVTLYSFCSLPNLADGGLQNLSLPKDHLWTPEGIRLITYILYPPLRMNLSVGTDNDEACVLWPNLSTWRVVENLPFLWLTSHYLYPSEERSHHTRWPLILRFTQPPRTPFGVGSMVCLNHILNLYQYFQRTLPFFKRGWMYIYAHKNPFFSIFVICSLEGIRTTCEAFTIFLNLDI